MQRDLVFRAIKKSDAFCIYGVLQTAIDKRRDPGAGPLVVCCTEAASLLGRDTEENRAAVPALVYDRLDRSQLTIFTRR
ncbi:hypothetical protein Y032_0002g617 [Ancylostoma ceylanicum]|uniref:Uncharacterized protein n=1 Tax=Ancylostoma ceylanicum TaxID=53326 RepID=A0A016W0G0_9BILA|nr:hypothetical protein Y032_0002g617 [Ancylostoma ceylanicum]